MDCGDQRIICHCLCWILNMLSMPELPLTSAEDMGRWGTQRETQDSFGTSIINSTNWHCISIAAGSAAGFGAKGKALQHKKFSKDLVEEKHAAISTILSSN